MEKIKNIFLKLSNKKYSIIFLNLICMIPSIIILYSSFSIFNLFLVILLIAVSNLLFIFIKKKNNIYAEKKSYEQFLEYLTLFCFYQENDFEKFLSISNCIDISHQLAFYKSNDPYMNSAIIVETVKKYKNLKYQKTLEQAVEIIEDEQDKLEEELSCELNERNNILPLLLIILFFSSFLFSIVSLIIGGLNG